MQRLKDKKAKTKTWQKQSEGTLLKVPKTLTFKPLPSTPAFSAENMSPIEDIGHGAFILGDYFHVIDIKQYFALGLATHLKHLASEKSNAAMSDNERRGLLQQAEEFIARECTSDFLANYSLESMSQKFDVMCNHLTFEKLVQD